MSETLYTKIDEHGVMTVVFDHAGKSVNTFSSEVLDDLGEVIDLLEQGSRDIAGVIFTSAKPDVFISGADLFQMQQMDHQHVQQFLEQGQGLFDRIAKLAIPTVAAINGHCLGGGLELALACNRRVAADNGEINIGLPETKLGIIPAWGGTTRLTAMLGPARTLSLLLTGRTMPPRRALRARVIDEVVRPEALLAAARRQIGLGNPGPTVTKKVRPSRLDRLIMAVPPLCNLVCSIARRRAHEKTFGNYPAADMVIDAVRTACRGDHDASLLCERESVMRLFETSTCQNLMRLFFLRHGAKLAVRKKLKGTPQPVTHAAVIGGGTMGSGIVHALINADIHVRLVDIDVNAISQALCRIKKLLDDDVKSKRRSPLQAEQAMRRVSPVTLGVLESQPGGLKLADVVIEAVAEKMDVKRQVFELLDRTTRPDAVLASNTSSMSVTEMSEAINDPSRLVGLHFFNPVSKMPLVEVVRTPVSDDQALATAAQLSLRMGKTPILVNDAPGFLVNRVLIPYLAEALTMCSEGESIVRIDLAMKRWGMPMGPFELLDQIGLDVAIYILHSLEGVLGKHVSVPDWIDQLGDRGWLGRKSGRGFYEYKGRKAAKGRKLPNGQLAELIRSGNAFEPAGKLDDAAIVDRLVLPMVNEAARLLDEGVTDSTDMIDLGTVFGLGLAPFRGGLIQYAQDEGLSQLVERMRALSLRYGPRFAPVEALSHAAEAGLDMQQIAGGNGHKTEKRKSTKRQRQVSGSFGKVTTGIDRGRWLRNGQAVKTRRRTTGKS